MDKVYIIYLRDKPYTKYVGKIYFNDEAKANNFRNNLIRSVGRDLYKGEDCWYEIGEKAKQYWFEQADKLLSIKTYIIEQE